MNIANLRKSYERAELSEDASHADPLQQFDQWLHEAIRSEIPEPNAMTVATVGSDLRPSTRVVLIKGYDAHGIVWYTNYDSRKGRELAGNPYAALQFHWVELERVVRIEGVVERVSAEESDAYYQSRPLDSRIGAWASPQSHVIAGRGTLVANAAKYGAQFLLNPPRPPHWGGYRLKPQQWEFHAYGMTANGPIGKICRAYGFAGAYYVTPMWHVQGEYVKNVRKLPLNNERPYSFNYGLHYGTADVLKGGSYEFGLDYVYSQAGTYFGGSSDDIVDQYMGHIYKNWHGMKNVPAYIADKMDAQLSGTDSANRNYGGAKFFLAKASFVPMRGLIIDAEYGFNAKDMGGRKMDNMFMLKATAYLK